MTSPSKKAVEGRALVARPSLCLLAVMLFVFVTASAAQAAIPAPILRGTNPISPGAATRPLIQGEIEGVETKAVHLGLGLRAIGPIARDLAEPNNTVKLYTDAACLGSVVGEGTARKLAEEGGIQVSAPLAPDSLTIFYATQSNSENTSACSGGVSYRQVTTAPTMPILESVSPASPANDNFPHLRGSADPEATVGIYATTDCSGAPLESDSGATFGAEGIQVFVPNNSETTFHAMVTMAGFTTPCSSSSISYREVTPATPPGPGGGGGGGGGSADGGTSAPPDVTPAVPRPRTIPEGGGNNNMPLVIGTAVGATTVRVYATPDCSGSPVAKGSAGEFAAGLSVQVADNTAVVFTAVAVSGGGKASKCSGPVTYVEDSLTPHTRITMGPAAKTAKRKAIFRFTDTTGNAPGTAFRCRVDRRKWKGCTSPLRLRGLRPRRYLIQVKATDPAGNAEQRGAKRSFRVVTRP
jgi:hypothetical protein